MLVLYCYVPQELADTTRKSTASSASFTFDPSKGLDYGSGQETEI